MAKQIRNRVLQFLTEKERQEKRRIKMSDIAREIGVSPNTVTSWVRDEVTKIESHVLIGLCEYFNCRIEDLIYIGDADEPLTTIATPPTAE